MNIELSPPGIHGLACKKYWSSFNMYVYWRHQVTGYRETSQYKDDILPVWESHVKDKTVDRLIFKMGITIPGKTVFILKQGPGSLLIVGQGFMASSHWCGAKCQGSHNKPVTVVTCRKPEKTSVHKAFAVIEWCETQWDIIHKFVMTL